jgi:hypothetical protein
MDDEAGGDEPMMRAEPDTEARAAGQRRTRAKWRPARSPRIVPPPASGAAMSRGSGRRQEPDRTQNGGPDASRVTPRRESRHDGEDDQPGHIIEDRRAKNDPSFGGPGWPGSERTRRDPIEVAVSAAWRRGDAGKSSAIAMWPPDEGQNHPTADHGRGSTNGEDVFQVVEPDLKSRITTPARSA